MNHKIKAKLYDLNKILSNWEKEGTLDIKKKILERIPKNCIRCNSENIDYWGETDEEIVFQCVDCKAFNPIPFDPSKLHFYFL